MSQRSITIVGAGIVGLTSALALHEAGHAVRLIDPAPPGSGASAANGGQLSWAFVAPLAEPGVIRKLPGWLLRPASPLRWVPRFDPALPAWGLAFLRASNKRHAHATTSALLGLAALGKPLLEEWCTRHKLEFDWRANGKLVVYRDTGVLDKARRQTALQRKLGVEQEVLDRDALLAREPRLAHHRDALAGGVWTPGEEVGDCAACCRAIASHLQAQGVTIERRRLARLDSRAGKVRGWYFDDGERQSRAPDETLVVAAGLASRALLAPLGIRLPLYPLKGYSLTLGLDASERTFAASVTDAERKLVYARLGSDAAARLRIAGIADLDGWHTRPRTSRVTLLKRQASEFLPELAERIQTTEAWTGLRPTTPDGRPRLGPTGIDGLWVNAGHGALGWTLAPGSARVLAQVFSGHDSTTIAAFALDRSVR